jgi:hypothetical protein
MEPIAYDCIGCKKCWGADAIVQLANHFEEVAASECSSNDDRTAEPFGVTLDGDMERRVGGPLLELARLAVGVCWQDARLDRDESGAHENDERENDANDEASD